MKRKSIVLIIALVLSVSLVACSTNNTDKTDNNTQTEQAETEKETVVLTDYVKGLKDWTVQVDAKNVNFLDGVTFDKEVVKEVTADDSKVNLSKEGKYDLIYSITPMDDSISKETVTKTVTVNVVSIEQAQEEADKGNQVVTDGGEIKKDSNGNTPKPPKEEKPVNKPTDEPSKPDNGGGNNNQGNDNNNNQGGNSGNTQPPKEDKPADPKPPVHEHSWKNVPAKTHTEYKTETYTEQVPKYKWVAYYTCNICHKQFDNVDDCGDHCIYDCGGGYSVAEKKIQDGYETVTKEKKVPYEVVDDPAHKECSCGARQ